MTELEIKTTNEINEWFSQDITDFQLNCNNYKDKNQNEMNILLGETVNKKWISFESLKELLKRSIQESEVFYEETNDTQTQGQIIAFKSILKELQND